MIWHYEERDRNCTFSSLAASDEMKRRMYSCILLVGGGAKFEGLSTWLHNRLLLQIPFQFRPEQTEIIVQPKDMDPSMVSVKRAAIMSCLESAQELWIILQPCRHEDQ